MNIFKIIDNIINTLPNDILTVSESLYSVGITPEIKLSYYLYKQLTRNVLEADIDFQVADTYEHKKNFYQKDLHDLQDNKIICKQINVAYKQLLETCVYKFQKQNINLDIESHIELLHPDAEITHSDIVLICQKKPIFCNPILDLLESKSEYRITNFAKPLSELPNQEYANLLENTYGTFYSLNKNQLEQLDIATGDNFQGIYRNDFEDQLFEQLRNTSAYLEDNIQLVETADSNIIPTQSGLYKYLLQNKKKYHLEDQNNLKKSKVDFLLDNLSNITNNQFEVNAMSRYLYYIRLIRRLFKENLIGKYELRTCKYKNEGHDKVVLLLLVSIYENSFFYILPDEKEKFSEISLEELKNKIHDKNNPLQIYHRPYQNQTGPLAEDSYIDIYDLGRN